MKSEGGGIFFGMVTGRDGVRLRFRRREREEMRCGQPSEMDLGSGGGQLESGRSFC